jgi:DNA-dependent RNA polymerase auxiliary subunit epsilon
MADFGTKFASLILSHTISQRGANAIWNFLGSHREAFADPNGDRPKFPSYKTFYRKLVKEIPVQVTMDVLLVNSDTNEKDLRLNLHVFPRKELAGKPELKLQWVITKSSVHELRNFHLQLHPNTTAQQWRDVLISDDGIPESKSTSISFDVVSINFIG